MTQSLKTTEHLVHQKANQELWLKIKITEWPVIPKGTWSNLQLRTEGTRAERPLPIPARCHSLHSLLVPGRRSQEKEHPWPHTAFEALVSKISLRAWRRDSAVKNTCCPYTGPGFTSQHTHGDSKLELQFLGAWYSLLTSMGTRLACGINTYTQAKHS